MSRRAATCERCGRAFGCGAGAGAGSGSCWCRELEVSTAAARRLAGSYRDCLCPDCLGELAGAGGGHAAGAVVTSTAPPAADGISR
jgi:hypothetical protein